MYNVELYNRTAGKVVSSKKASTDREASKAAADFIGQIKEKYSVVKESNYDINPRGFVIGQTLYTTDAVFDVTAAKL